MEAQIEKLGVLYTEAAKVLNTELGYDLFFAAGTLLGVVRDDGKMIEADDDFDSAYLSRHQDPVKAAEELVVIGVALNKAGLDAHVSIPMRTHLHVHDHTDYKARIDVFFYYRNPRGCLQVPPGVSNPGYEVTSWEGCIPATWEGFSGLVPANSESILHRVYGADWRTPKIGSAWSWSGKLLRSREQARLTFEQVEAVEKTRSGVHPELPPCEKL